MLILPLVRYGTVGGGGGGSAPTLRGAASLATAYSTNNGTTASFTAGGTNPCIIGSIVGRQPSSPSPVLGSPGCRYGGSGGTSMGSPMTSSDRQFYSDSCRAGRYIAVPGPSGTSEIYATFSTDSLGTIVQGVAFENVHQTAPYDSVAVNSGNFTDTTGLASVNVTGISSGDIILAHFATGYGSNDGIAFDNTGITDNVILTQPSAGESRTWDGGVWVMQVASGTSCNMQIRCNQTTSSDLFWDAYAFRLVPA
jgi:hypothetical protein